MTWQGGSHQTRRRSGLIRFGENERPGVPQSAHTANSTKNATAATTGTHGSREPSAQDTLATRRLLMAFTFSPYVATY